MRAVLRVQDPPVQGHTQPAGKVKLSSQPTTSFVPPVESYTHSYLIFLVIVTHI